MRLDKQQGDAEFVALDLIQDGRRVVYTHSDQSVDVAVVPVLPDHNIFDFKMIPDDLLTTKTSFDQFPISESRTPWSAAALPPTTGPTPSEDARSESGRRAIRLRP